MTGAEQDYSNVQKDHEIRLLRKEVADLRVEIVALRDLQTQENAQQIRTKSMEAEIERRRIEELQNLEKQLQDARDKCKASDQAWLRLSYLLLRDNRGDSSLTPPELEPILRAIGIPNVGSPWLGALPRRIPSGPVRLKIIDEYTNTEHRASSAKVLPVSAVLEQISVWNDSDPSGHVDDLDDLIRLQVLVLDSVGPICSHVPLIWHYLIYTIGVDIEYRRGLRILVAISMLTHLYHIAPITPAPTPKMVKLLELLDDDVLVAFKENLFQAIISRNAEYEKILGLRGSVSTRAQLDKNVVASFIDSKKEFVSANWDIVSIHDPRLLETLILMQEVRQSGNWFSTSPELKFILNKTVNKVTLYRGRLRHEAKILESITTRRIAWRRGQRSCFLQESVLRYMKKYHLSDMNRAGGRLSGVAGGSDSETEAT